METTTEEQNRQAALKTMLDILQATEGIQSLGWQYDDDTYTAEVTFSYDNQALRFTAADYGEGFGPETGKSVIPIHSETTVLFWIASEFAKTIRRLEAEAAQTPPA